MKKELARRRKKMAGKLIVTGLVFACGCVLYFGSDAIVDYLTDRAIAAPKKKKSATRGGGNKVILQRTRRRTGR